MTPAVLDITVAVILLLSMGFAYWRGLVREVFTILALGLGVFAAWKGGDLLLPLFNDLYGVQADGGAQAAEIVAEGMNADITSTAAQKAAAHKDALIFGILSPGLAAKGSAFGSAFLSAFLTLSLIGFFISRGLQDAGLGVVDRLAGAGFGLARGFALVFLFYAPLTFLVGQENFPAWARNSMTVPVLDETLAWADEKFGLSQQVEDRGDGIAIRIGKVDPDALLDADGIEPAMGAAEDELKDALDREEPARRTGRP